MGGIGKTTLARVVFNKFYNDFEGSYFAPNVRENALKNGLDTLEKEVYSELFGDKNLDTFKSSAVNRRLSRTKALLVLDDVETPMQLKRLVGNRYQFGPGSKIIVTSRHKLVVDAEYKVEVLDFDDACKLFYLNAFGEKCCRRGYKEISDRVVEYTKCHPLAVEVLGASVFCFLESIEDWEKELEKLKRIPHHEIQVVLERSYDALDNEEKGLFLDIACFFKGERRDIVVGILADKPIAGLVRKSLITIEDDKIQMHDLIQEMGRNIVLRSTEKLGERSRLWIAQDVSFVLGNNKGTEAIEGIYLPWIEEELHLRPNVFEEMCKLRLLKIYHASPYSPSRSQVSSPKLRLLRKVKVYVDGDLKYLPNGLRYLHWEHYPGKSLPSNFKPHSLVELQMPNSKLEQLWDGVQKLGSLKHINLQYSELLTKIPDLSLAPKLESINLCECRSLIHVPSLNLQATLDESANQCKQKVFYHPSFLATFGEDKRTPGGIILSRCSSLTTLPKVCGNITKLVLSETALKELPSSIESLENLLVLDLRECKKLKSLPKLPRNIEVLSLGLSGIEQISSSSIECLCSLRRLSFQHCKSLSSLPSNINLKALEELNLVGTSIQELPSTIENSIGLRHLSLHMCLHLEFIPKTLGKLTRLQELNLSFCSKLESLPASIGMLYKLKKLDISYCKNLQSLPKLPLFIVSVDAEGCSSLEMVSTLRSTLTLGRWLDKYEDGHNYQREFSFLNCTKLGEDAINNIFREFLYKVFCTATTPPEVVHSVPKMVICEVVVYYPTKVIPRWFNNQSEGSSITIRLPPNWYNPKTFLGFVASVIFAKVDDRVDTLECELHLKTNCGERLEEVVFTYATFNGYSCVDMVWNLDNMFVWYQYFDHSKANFEKYQEVSLEFTSRLKVLKRCGVRMLYLKDAVEESDDGTTANFESWRTDVTDSDTSVDDFQSCGTDVTDSDTSDDDFQSCGSDDGYQS